MDLFFRSSSRADEPLFRFAFLSPLSCFIFFAFFTSGEKVRKFCKKSGSSVVPPGILHGGTHVISVQWKNVWPQLVGA